MANRLRRLARHLLLPSGDGSHAEALVTLLRLRWFLWLRWSFIAAAGSALLIERVAYPRDVRPVALYGLVVALAGLNVLWSGLSRRFHRKMCLLPLAPSERQTDEVAEALERATIFANAQIAADLFFLTAILRYTGGVENPLAVFYLFHVVIGALLLPAMSALAQSCWAVLLYGSMAYGELVRAIAPHYPLFPHAESWHIHDHPPSVAAAVIAVGLGIFGALYFIMQITWRLDEHEHHLRLANQELQASRDAIRDLQARRAAFMRTAAHQLKSPLAIIQTMVNLLREGVVPSSAVEATYDRMAHRCREGIEQVGELLALARVHDADPDRHRSARADVAETLRHLTSRYAASALSKQVAVHCAIRDGESLIANVDPRDLNDALDNLLDNAVKYSRHGGTVRVTATRNGESVSIQVSDDGIGIDPQSLPHIFEEYRRGENALAAGISGTGLGLSIVQAITRQAGGEITVQSLPGQGASFSITLRAADTKAVRDCE